MELQEQACCTQKGLWGSYALLLQSPTDSSGLWDKALNYNSSSSHARPLHSEAWKDPVIPFSGWRFPSSLPCSLRPGEPHSALLDLCANPFVLRGRLVQCVKGKAAGSQGQGTVGWQRLGAALPRVATSPWSPISSSPPASPRPHAASTLPASLSLLEYIKSGKTCYCTRHRGVFWFFKACFCVRQRGFKVDLFTSELSSPSNTCFGF